MNPLHSPKEWTQKQDVPRFEISETWDFSGKVWRMKTFFPVQIWSCYRRQGLGSICLWTAWIWKFLDFFFLNNVLSGIPNDALIDEGSPRYFGTSLWKDDVTREDNKLTRDSEHSRPINESQVVEPTLRREPKLPDSGPTRLGPNPPTRKSGYWRQSITPNYKQRNCIPEHLHWGPPVGPQPPNGKGSVVVRNLGGWRKEGRGGAPWKRFSL